MGRRCNYGGGARGVIMWEVYRKFYVEKPRFIFFKLIPYFKAKSF